MVMQTVLQALAKERRAENKRADVMRGFMSVVLLLVSLLLQNA